jgi:DNA-binding MarR family transcriptional regulator
MSDELVELKRISKILTLANATILEKELEKYATTPERKKVWVLINGERSPDDLIAGSGMKQAGVYKFLKILSDADLIETPHGNPPKKKLELVPASWLDLFEAEKEEPKQKQKGEQNVQTTTNQ